MASQPRPEPCLGGAEPEGFHYRKINLVAVPAYCTSRGGKVFRVTRSSELVAADRVRYALRAVPIVLRGQDATVEVSREYDTTLVRDKISLGQTIPTPEETFEQLWQQLRLDLDVGYD